MNETVHYIRQKNLCTACGTCAGLCPGGAIRMTRNAADFLVPEIDTGKCTHCGLCLRACPGAGLPVSLIGGFRDCFTGESMGAWIGRAADEDLWKNGQSGGVASALLLYLLQTGRIDSAIVNSFDERAKRPIVMKARNKQELLSAQGSWYAQSAVNELAIGGEGRTAAVVLGCQAEGVALARLHAKGRTAPEYLIGLVCAGNHSGLIIDDLIAQSGSDRDSVSSFRFRDKSAGGWPGNVLIRSGGKSAVLDKGRRIALKDCYGNYRCQCCFDQMNVFSDVVVGDPWGIDGGKDRVGRSMLLAHTEKGLELVESAIRDGFIVAETVSIDAVCRGQTVDSRLKPQFFACRAIADSEGLPFPSYGFGDDMERSASARIKKVRLYRRTLHQKYTVQGMESRELVEKTVQKMKTRNRIRSIPEKIAFLIKRVLRRIYRLMFRGKGV